jgi:hypothetical protein
MVHKQNAQVHKDATPLLVGSTMVAGGGKDMYGALANEVVGAKLDSNIDSSSSCHNGAAAGLAVRSEREGEGSGAGDREGCRGKAQNGNSDTSLGGCGRASVGERKTVSVRAA